MSSTFVPPIEPIGLTPSLSSLSGTGSIVQGPHGTGSFADMLVGGIDGVSAKVAHADALSKAFILDDSIPVHQVTFALEQARLSLELMMQVRGRLIEGYQQLMNMQL